ncbi:MAG: LysR substrate-binding domain-containing protein [Lautropia sp.]
MATRTAPPTSLRPLPDMATWLNRLKLRHLNVLLTISRHESLTAAGTALRMSQPAVSKWLADMEATLGVPLFARGKPLRPTPYANALLRHAERILGEARSMHEAVEAVREGALGIVRIGVMSAATSVLLPGAITALQRASPRLRMVVIEDIATGLWARFARGELDVIVGLLGDGALAGDQPSAALYAEPYRVVAGLGHPLARRRSPTWDDAARHPWILPPVNTPLRHAIDATFNQAGVASPRPKLESVSFTTNLVLLRDDDSLAVISSSAAMHYQSLRVLRAVALEIRHGIGPVSMVWRDRQPPAEIARVLSALRACARRIASRPPPAPQA